MTHVSAPSPAPAYEGVPFDNVLKCVHCGLCLDACPTYRETGVEQDSPRGRLYLMRGLWEGELQPSPEVAAPLDRCLDCRACETACPSAVPYGELLEKTRGVLAENLPKSLFHRLVAAVFLKRVLSSTVLLWMVSIGGLIYRKLGLRLLITRTPLASLLPAWVVRGNHLMPPFEGRSFKRHRFEPLAKEEGKGPHVALFTGCIMDVADHPVHKASVAMLRAAGCKVSVPKDQGCCGALAVHNGERERPRQLAKQNLAAFQDVDQVIVNAAGCGAQLHEYADLFSDSNEPDPQPWLQFADKTNDILLFLNQLEGFPGKIKWRQEQRTVLYDAPCHLFHAQKTDAPRALLARIPNLTLAPLCDADRCCGAAGVYNLVQGELSEQILARKLDDIEATLSTHPQADTLVTGNPGCLFQIRHGVQKRGLPLRVLHPIQLLDELSEK